MTPLQHHLEEVPDDGPTGRPRREVFGPAPGGGPAAPPPTEEEEGEGEEKDVREVHCLSVLRAMHWKWLYKKRKVGSGVNECGLPW